MKIIQIYFSFKNACRSLVGDQKAQGGDASDYE